MGNFDWCDFYRRNGGIHYCKKKEDVLTSAKSTICRKNPETCPLNKKEKEEVTLGDFYTRK